MARLSSRQKEVLLFIEGYIRERGYPPSMREICEVMGISSTNGVNDHLRALERKGYIERDKNVQRGIRVLIAPPGEIQQHRGMFTAGTKYAGTFRASPEVLQGVGAIDRAMKELVKQIGMTTLGTHIYDVPLAVKRLGQEVLSDEGGVTAVVVLSTSHAALHTWPEESGARFDVDSCREFDVNIVRQVLIEFLGAEDIVASDLSHCFQR